DLVCHRWFYIKYLDDKGQRLKRPKRRARPRIAAVCKKSRDIKSAFTAFLEKFNSFVPALDHLAFAQWESVRIRLEDAICCQDFACILYGNRISIIGICTATLFFDHYKRSFARFLCIDFFGCKVILHGV